MFLPDFFVVGAPKSGTTALFDCLKQHPDIFMSPVKEPKYFLFGGAPPRIQPGPAGKRNLGVGVWRSSDYFRLFAGAQDHQKKGEATTDYLRSPEAAPNQRQPSQGPDHCTAPPARRPRLFPLPLYGAAGC